MAHCRKTVAPDAHPICCSCADLPLSGMPLPPARISVGGAAALSAPDRVDRHAGADVEGCCWCGVETDQGYYALEGPPKGCSEQRIPMILPPGTLRRLWRRLMRWLTQGRPFR